MVAGGRGTKSYLSSQFVLSLGWGSAVESKSEKNSAFLQRVSPGVALLQGDLSSKELPVKARVLRIRRSWTPVTVKGSHRTFCTLYKQFVLKIPGK